MVQEKLLWFLRKVYKQGVTDGGGVEGGLVLVAAHAHWLVGGREHQLQHLREQPRWQHRDALREGRRLGQRRNVKGREERFRRGRRGLGKRREVGE